MAQRLVLSGKFDKPAAYKLKDGATKGSPTYSDYVLSGADWDKTTEDVITFPPVVISARPNANLLRFQGGGNTEPFVMVITYKADDQNWLLAPLRVFTYNGATPNDAFKLPPGTVAVSLRRADAGTGAVGYTLDLDI